MSTAQSSQEAAPKTVNDLECKAWSENEIEHFRKIMEEGYALLPRYVNNKKFVTNSPVPPTSFEQLPRYEAQFLLSKEKMSLCGLIRFGTSHIEGPPGCVHGGASAAIIDAIMGTVTWECGYVAVTLNLNVNYKKFLPTNNTVFVETKVEKLEGKKIFVSASIKSLDRETTHVDATGLFFDVSEKYKK